eukprot:scaffold96069_cov72-Phaeocystis_antarctica.AAC.6
MTVVHAQLRVEPASSGVVEPTQLRRQASLHVGIELARVAKVRKRYVVVSPLKGADGARVRMADHAK